MNGPIVVSGCFNIITPAQMELIHKASLFAKDAGREIDIVINSDWSVSQQKGCLILSADERRQLLKCISGIRSVRVFEDMPTAIREVKPSIWIKGSEWIGRMPQEDIDALRYVKASLMFMGPFDGPHASDIIERIKRS